MTELGKNLGLGTHAQIITHANGLNQLQVNAIIRNGCSSEDPLDRGTYFIKESAVFPGAISRWWPFNPKENAVVKSNPDLEMAAEQIFLPVEQVSAQRLMQWRADMRLSDQVVGPIRKKFEETLGIEGYYRIHEGECDCDYDDNHCENCYDQPFEVSESVVAAAWLAAAKAIIASQDN